jgi:hypothetical protein
MFYRFYGCLKKMTIIFSSHHLKIYNGINIEHFCFFLWGGGMLESLASAHACTKRSTHTTNLQIASDRGQMRELRRQLDLYIQSE